MKTVALLALGATLVACGGCTPTLTLDDGVAVRVPLERRPNGDYLTVLAFSRTKLLAVGKGAEVQIWDTTTGRRVSTAALEVPRPGYELSNPVSSLSFSPDGSRLACASYGGALAVLEVATGTVLARVPGPEHAAEHGEWDTLVAFDRLGERLGFVASRWADGKPFATFRIFEASSVREVETFDMPLNIFRANVEGVFSPELRWFFTGRALVDVAARRTVAEPRWFHGDAARFSPDERVLVGAGYGDPTPIDPALLQGAVNAGGPPGVVTLALRPDPAAPGAESIQLMHAFVRWTGFTANGRVLSAAESNEGGIAIWDVERQTRVAELRIPRGGNDVRDAVFSLDASLLATDMQSGGVLVWRLPKP
jgi:WD40 repeat protein